MNTQNSVNHIFFVIVLGMGLFLTAPHHAAYATADENPGEASFAVLGNCGMCKDRIERAAYSVRGVRLANWNEQEQSLTVTWRPQRTDQEEIERAIAKAGHDTENFLTHDEIHANLHHCCIYERNPEWLEKNKRFDEE